MQNENILRGIENAGKYEQALLGQSVELLQMMVVFKTRMGYFSQSPNAGASEISEREARTYQEYEAKWRAFWNQNASLLGRYISEEELKLQAQLAELYAHAYALAVDERHLAALEGVGEYFTLLDPEARAEYDAAYLHVRQSIEMSQGLWGCISRNLREEHRNTILSEERRKARTRPVDEKTEQLLVQLFSGI